MRLPKQSPGLVALVMLSLGLFALSAGAVGGDRQEHGAKPANSAVVVIDHMGHRRVIRDFFAREAFPPGLATRESLPPGLVTQLRAQGRLPPGLQKRLTPIPPDLDSRLPAVPPYFSRYFAGRDLVIIDMRTDRIVSVIRDILP